MLDKKHLSRHNKAEYFSSVIEGGLVVLAAFSIIWPSILRIFNLQTLAKLG